MKRLILLAVLAAQLHAADFPAPKFLGDVESYGRNIQRTLRLLAESTPEHPCEFIGRRCKLHLNSESPRRTGIFSQAAFS
ncbi:MAG: hypothetical protein QOE70_5746 [Chthoniobacter sp.]|jgi:hypothetical protein|nr:hypothetical protein [Chthoniobacter sp.]